MVVTDEPRPLIEVVCQDDLDVASSPHRHIFGLKGQPIRNMAGLLQQLALYGAREAVTDGQIVCCTLPDDDAFIRAFHMAHLKEYL